MKDILPIHQAKNAGSAIANYLQKHANDRLCPPRGLPQTLIGGQHSPLCAVPKSIPRNSYEVLGVVRCPLDRAISAHAYFAPKANFTEWVCGFWCVYVPTDEEALTLGDGVWPEHLLRFSHLEDDFQIAMDELGVAGPRLGVANPGKNPKHAMTDEAEECLRDKFCKTFDLLQTL